MGVSSILNSVILLLDCPDHVTEDFDEEQIIDQHVTRISHRDQVADLVQKGRDLEGHSAVRAVRWHLDHRILFYGNKTVGFD